LCAIYASFSCRAAVSAAIAPLRLPCACSYSSAASSAATPQPPAACRPLGQSLRSLHRRGGLLRRRLLRLLGRLGLGGSTRLAGATDRLDLDLRQRRAKTCVAAVAGALLVLADADLRPTLLADDADGDGHPFRRDRDVAVAADEQHLRREGGAVVELHAVDEQPLALTDAVLLAADGDDRVAHSGVPTPDEENAGRRPRADG
jgi:hypothetical protein